MFQYVLVASLGAAFALAAGTASTDLKAVLLQRSNNWSPSTQIFFPSDPNYANETTQRWNIYSAPTYLASIKPGTTGDVQKVVSVLFAFSPTPLRPRIIVN